MRKSIMMATVLLALATPLFAAPSYLGSYSGTILVPDSLTTPHGQWDLSFHDAFSLFGNQDVRATGIQYGLDRKLELGVSLLQDGGSKAAFSGKYRLVEETSSVPAVAVGVFDIGNQVESLDNSTSFYLILSKNITPFASNVSGMPSKPLRLSIGGGSGIFNGFLASLDWTLAPRFSVQAEYFGGHVGYRDHIVNAGVRYAFNDMVRLDAGTIDFKKLGVGVSLRTQFK